MLQGSDAKVLTVLSELYASSSRGPVLGFKHKNNESAFDLR